MIIIVVGAGVVVIFGKLHGGVSAEHWTSQPAMAVPVPPQLHVPVVPHPTTVPGRGLQGQQVEQHHAHSGLAQGQPLAHPLKLLPTG